MALYNHVESSMTSLKDQLLKAGVIDTKKAKQIEKEKRKNAKQQPKSAKGSAKQDSESRAAAKQTLAQKSARDRQLNQQKEELALQKAIAAQIDQLITMNQINTQNAETAYQFTASGKIKKIYVLAEQQQKLATGLIAIAQYKDSFVLIPTTIAEKIQQRDESRVIVKNSKEKAAHELEEELYADFKIPDDLMW